MEIKIGATALDTRGKRRKRGCGPADDPLIKAGPQTRVPAFFSLVFFKSVSSLASVTRFLLPLSQFPFFSLFIFQLFSPLPFAFRLLFARVRSGCDVNLARLDAVGFLVSGTVTINVDLHQNLMRLSITHITRAETEAVLIA